MGSPTTSSCLATNSLAEVTLCLYLDAQSGTETREGRHMPEATHPKPRRHLRVLILLTLAGSSLQPSFLLAAEPVALVPKASGKGSQWPRWQRGKSHIDSKAEELNVTSLLHG